MIPQIVASRRTAGWARRVVSPFERGREERNLKLFIDDASLSTEDLASSIIRDLIGHPLIEVSTTALDADPRLEVKKVAGPYPNDVATVLRLGTRTSGETAVRYASQKIQLANRYARSGTDTAALAQRILLVDHAELCGADAFVTSAPELHSMASDGIYAGANIMHPAEAVAIAGLFLRLRCDFAYFHSGGFTATYGKEGFYALLAGDLLPALERWIAICPDLENSFLSSPLKLAWSVRLRVERALYARDRIHEQLLLPSTQLDDGALFYLDSFLYSLAGAFDAIARIVHAVYEMNGSARRANWRDQKKNGWLQELAVKAPTLAQSVAAESPHRDALELIFLLRNWIHAEGLSSVGVLRDPSDRIDHRLLLPPDDTPTLLLAFDRLGGRDAWELEQVDASVYLIDIGTFVERVLPCVLKAMEELMSLTPVESLKGANSFIRRPLDARMKDAIPRIRLLSGL
ncbi:MAG: hypothetical protein QM831_11935 [Kofleriaceae bacterium]